MSDSPDYEQGGQLFDFLTNHHPVTFLFSFIWAKVVWEKKTCKMYSNCNVARLVSSYQIPPLLWWLLFSKKKKSRTLSKRTADLISWQSAVPSGALRLNYHCMKKLWLLISEMRLSMDGAPLMDGPATGRMRAIIPKFNELALHLWIVIIHQWRATNVPS